MKLYRYQPINKYSIENLVLKQNWASNPLSFNDPFEFPLKSEISLTKTGTVTYLTEKQRENRNQILKEISNLGVVSYSSKEDATLLWSHYADFHRGMCLVFSTHEKDDSINKVKYRKTIPPFKFNKNSNYYNVVTTKSVDWKYESEYREIFGNCNCPYPHRGELVEIIFGCQTPIQDIELIFRICESVYSNKIELSKMFIQADTFQLSKTTTTHIAGQNPPYFWNSKTIGSKRQLKIHSML